MENHIIILVIFCVTIPFLIAIIWKLNLQKIQNAPLKIRRKRLRILLYAFIAVLLIISIVGSGKDKSIIDFLKELFSHRSFILLIIFLLFNFIYAYFRKDKTPNEKEIAEEQVNK